MTEPAQSNNGWSKSKWLCYIAIASGMQLFLAWKYSTPPKVPSPQTEHETVLNLLGHPLGGPAIEELSRLTDPTLMGRPSDRGFSGDAWLHPEPLPHHVYEWNDSPSWLPLDASRLGDAFLSFARTNLPKRLTLASSLPVDIARLPLANDLLPTQSVMRLESGFEGLSLSSKVSLPALHETELLSNSVVQVLVDDHGLVLSTTVLSSSGSRQADELALKTARGLRFSPFGTLAKGSLSWGTLSFSWLTQP